MSVAIYDKKRNVSVLKVIERTFNEFAEKTAFFVITKSTHSTGRYCTLSAF